MNEARAPFLDDQDQQPRPGVVPDAPAKVSDVTAETDEPEASVLDDPPDAEEYALSDADMLEVMLAGREEKASETQVIQIDRGERGRYNFWFRVRGIADDEDDLARTRATTYQRVGRRRMGMNVPEKLDVALYRSHTILLATVEFVRPVKVDPKTGDPVATIPDPLPDDPDHRKIEWTVAKNMWEDAALRSRLGVGGKAEVIDKILNVGEKDRVIERIEVLSGLDDDEKKEHAKN